MNTPAIANIAGDEDSPPEIVLGTNEEYRVNEGNEGDFNASPVNAASINALQQAGSAADLSLANANGRVYAVHADGNDHAGGPFVDGWPVKLGLLMSELLPVVGEGVNGSPVIAPLTCPQGGEGRKVGVIPAAGLGYVLNGDGTSCMDVSGRARDRAAVRRPGAAGPRRQPLPRRRAAGLRHDRRPHDLPGARRRPAPRARSGGERVPGRSRRDGGVEPRDGPVHARLPGAGERPVLPHRAPSWATWEALPGEEIVAGTASMDLQAFNAAGEPASNRWPRLHGDWMVSTPLIGSFGQKETDEDATQVVVALTRRGTVFAYDTPAPACSPASSPRFHHDNHNSGDFERDAVAPGLPEGAALDGSALHFTAPGDDLLCGTADRYELVHSDQPDRLEATSATAEPLDGAPEPDEAGAEQSATAAGRREALRGAARAGRAGQPGSHRVGGPLARSGGRARGRPPGRAPGAGAPGRAHGLPSATGGGDLRRNRAGAARPTASAPSRGGTGCCAAAVAPPVSACEVAAAFYVGARWDGSRS